MNADRAGIAPVMAGFVAVMCVATVAVVAIPTTAGLLTAAVLLGVRYGGVDALLAPLLASLFGAEDLSSMFGAVTPAFGVVGGIVPYIVGAGFDQLGSSDVPFLFAASIGTISVLAFAAIARIES